MRINEEAIERLAYMLIRREVRRFDRTTTDSELANYVRGIVDLQTELYGELSKENTKEVYNKGFSDGQKALAEHLKLCKEELLNKIRAEIEEQVLESLSDGGDDWFTAEKVNECLDIIDKYKTEN